MRVIAGIARGRTLISPSGIKTRPTGDRMKEDLFNIISPLVPGSQFLDLFCGSGAIGIEALSRKAKFAYFVDNSKDAIKAVNKNLQNTRFTDTAQVLHMDASLAIQQIKHLQFNIIFMDPPYDSSEAEKIVKQAALLLSEDGILILECPLNAKIDSTNLVEYRRKKYSQMQFIFFNKGCDRDDSNISRQF